MRYYSVSFKENLVWMFKEKSASQKENDAIEADKNEQKSALEALQKEISEIEGVKSVEISDNGHIVGIEAEDEEDLHAGYPVILNKVINIYRRFDDSTVVKYDFQLNNQA